ncbi:MAG TPA: hypothetical protein VEQ85_10375 [Lacipirellulaceae bacterium]|nr:hypothetical protein [Lacipirellulaceae bacterium]
MTTATLDAAPLSATFVPPAGPGACRIQAAGRTERRGPRPAPSAGRLRHVADVMAELMARHGLEAGPGNTSATAGGR